MSKWFRGFRLKMLSLISVSSMLFIALAGYSIYVCQDLQGKLNQANTVRIPLTQGTNDMAYSLQTIARFLWVAAVTRSPEDLKMAQENIRLETESFENYEKQLNDLPKPEFIQKKFDELKESWVPFKKSFQGILAEATKGTDEGRAEPQRLITIELRPLIDRSTGIIEEMNKFRLKLITELAAEDQRQAAETKTILTTVSIFSLILLGVLGFLIASQVASVLTRAIQNLSHHSQEVSQASEGLSTSATELSSGATETASALEETVASTEELNSMVQSNSSNASQASALALEGKSTAEAGEKQITELYTAVGEVSVASKKIEEIINVIDDIAFQTNLLALNAAVEAARAGEQGKGFAVVAEAVRSLAQRSSVAAKDIGTLINDSVQKISNSQELAEKGKESLGQIVKSIHRITDINAEIATAGKEQADGLTSIAKAMNEIDKATQQNASASEEISATSEEMTSQSVALQGLVEELVAFIEGGAQSASRMISQASSKERKPAKPKASVAPAHTSAPVVKITKAASAAAVDLEAVLPMETDSKSERRVSQVSGF